MIPKVRACLPGMADLTEAERDKIKPREDYENRLRLMKTERERNHL